MSSRAAPPTPMLSGASGESLALPASCRDRLSIGRASCGFGCGGSGQAQWLGQSLYTTQDADSDAKAKQDGVNTNAPVSIGGGWVDGGSSSASQSLSNSADSSATNDASTNQNADQSQSSYSSCKKGCGGSGQAQFLKQDSSTKQAARSKARAKQHGSHTKAGVKIRKDKKGRKYHAKKARR